MKEKEELKLNHGGIILALRCNLRCKFCATYSTDYKDREDFSYEMLSESIDNYFSIIDEVKDFTITGGEPLLHKDLADILRKIFGHSEKIGRVMILTNGTIVFNNEVLELLSENRDKCQIDISNYEGLSNKAEELSDVLEQNQIKFRILEYSSKFQHADGWVDFTDHTQKYFTQEDIDDRGRQCIFTEWRNMIIIGGVIYRCGRAFRRIDTGIINNDINENIDLLNDEYSISDKKSMLIKMLNAPSIKACAYCSGMGKDFVRFPAAEQL